jgi:2-oxo-4-hydroxy-4-carboxy--5-ureidoimidazoline (OHCU) decarboxylase
MVVVGAEVKVEVEVAEVEEIEVAVEEKVVEEVERAHPDLGHHPRKKEVAEVVVEEEVVSLEDLNDKEFDSFQVKQKLIHFLSNRFWDTSGVWEKSEKTRRD